MFIAGVFASSAIFFVGDFLIRSVLGQEYLVASSILKIFVWIIPFRLANQALGLCMLIPMGKDRITSGLIMFFSILSILMAAALSIWYGVDGVVFGFVLAEICLFFALIAVVAKMTLQSLNGDKK